MGTDPSCGNRMGTEPNGDRPLLRGEISCRLAMFIAEFVLAYGVCPRLVPAVHDEKWPPLANEWGDAEYVIPGWILLGASEYPQPGMVAVKLAAGGHGHVGIVDFDGMLISAQEFKVTRASNPETWPVSPVFRTYKGN